MTDTGVLPRRWRWSQDDARTPYVVAASVLLVYGAWLLFCFNGGHPPRDFLYLGSQFVNSSHVSPAISESDAARHMFNDVGYDGQFSFYLAADPLNARYYMSPDSGGGAGYRYGRILYPMLARLLALGQVNVIPSALLLINWLALGFGTLGLASWLRRKRVSPWLALLYGLYPGLFNSLHKDLNEPLADAFVVLAIYVYHFGGRNRMLWAAACFAPAILTRETSLVFVLGYGCAVLLQGDGPRKNWWRALLFFEIALGPYELYQLFLRLWLPGTASGSQKAASVFSYHGIFAYWPWQSEQLDLVIALVVPGLLCAGMAVWALARRVWAVEVWILLLNVLIFTFLLNPVEYINFLALGRLHGAVVLTALCCLPAFRTMVGENRAWLWVVSILWFLPWYQIVPFAFRGPWLAWW